MSKRRRTPAPRSTTTTSCLHTTSSSSRRTKLPLSSTLLFLSIILPQTSYAQIIPPTSTPSPLPTTLITATSISSSTTPTATPPTIFTPPIITPPPSFDEDSDPNPQVSSEGQHVFRYYFLIIAVVAILFVLLVLYLGRRRKRKAEILRTNSQRALAQDVAGFHERFGERGTNPRFGAARGLGGAAQSAAHRIRGGRGAPFAFWGMRGGRGEEGLDERGEAPPPYGVGTKPPSLRSLPGGGGVAGGVPAVPGIGVGDGVRVEAVELRSIHANEHGIGNGSGNGNGQTSTEVVGLGEPPGYDEFVSGPPPTSTTREADLGDLDMTRPTFPTSVPLPPSPPAAVITRPENAVILEDVPVPSTTSTRRPGSS